MRQSLTKITSGEPILTYPHFKTKLSKKIYTYISEFFKKVNVYFGINENPTDQVWFYGFYGLSILMMIITYFIAGMMFGF